MAFVLLRITEDGTHEASCPRIPDLCGCRLNGYPNYIKLKDLIHRAECSKTNCRGSCAMDVSLSIAYIPASMPPRNTLGVVF
ncbi:hypothetical protein JTE90_016338 [Oedothorax gibbosus]|uniref:Uncharacterized protein n=1 Tax=Oedothorax gibbosus TaxID=931172 RepID=A0AAV6TQC0_9ARAC|nr:hypothetical protein JTE90_016338 [Oedothorax gibbosus]